MQDVLDYRILDGIYTDVLGVAYGKKSFVEILFKILPTARNILGCRIKTKYRFLDRLGP